MIEANHNNKEDHITTIDHMGKQSCNQSSNYKQQCNQSNLTDQALNNVGEHRLCTNMALMGTGCGRARSRYGCIRGGPNSTSVGRSPLIVRLTSVGHQPGLK